MPTRNRINLFAVPLAALIGACPLASAASAADQQETLNDLVLEALTEGVGHVEAGAYSEPIVMRRSNGVRYEGRSVRHTIVRFEGLPAGTPAITVTGCRGLSFKHVTFVRDTPGPIFKFHGHGASWYTFEDCNWLGAGAGRNKVTGVYLGEPSEGDNSDTTVFRRCWADGLKHFLEMNHIQSLLCAVYDSRMGGGESLIRIHHGGDVLVENTSLYNVPVCVRTAGGGPNTAAVTLINTRMDGDLKWQSGFTLIDAEDAPGEVFGVAIGCTLRGGHAAPQRSVFVPGRFWRLDTLGLTAKGLPLLPRDLEESSTEVDR